MLSHTPKPNPSESSAVVKNKHCDTKLRVQTKTGGDHRETHHNFSDAFVSSESVEILWCAFSRLFKKHVKLLIFIKDAFLKPTPTSFLPAEVVKGLLLVPISNKN